MHFLLYSNVLSSGPCWPLTLPPLVPTVVWSCLSCPMLSEAAGHQVRPRYSTGLCFYKQLMNDRTSQERVIRSPWLWTVRAAVPFTATVVTDHTHSHVSQVFISKQEEASQRRLSLVLDWDRMPLNHHVFIFCLFIWCFLKPGPVGWFWINMPQRTGGGNRVVGNQGE